MRLTSLLLTATAVTSLALPAAAGARGGVADPPPPARCADIQLATTSDTVRNLKMPTVKYNLANCGTEAIGVTVTVSEWASAWSVTCPSPVAAPVSYELAVNQKITAGAPVYRGSCFGRQGHNLFFTVTDDATGAQLDRASYSWQDRTGV